MIAVRMQITCVQSGFAISLLDGNGVVAQEQHISIASAAFYRPAAAGVLCSGSTSSPTVRLASIASLGSVPPRQYYPHQCHRR